jgi:hypothetical protein
METQLEAQFLQSGAKIFHFKIDSALSIVDAIQQARQQTNKLLTELLESQQEQDEPDPKKKIKLEDEESPDEESEEPL